MSDWVSTQHAAMVLHTSVETIGKLKDWLRWKTTKGGRGRPPRQWSRADVEELARIRRECRMDLRNASRVLVAKREGRL